MNQGEPWRRKALHSRPANCRLNWALSGPQEMLTLGSLPLLLRQVSVALHKVSVVVVPLGVAVLLRDVVLLQDVAPGPQPGRTLQWTLVLIRTTMPLWRLSGTADNNSRKMAESCRR